MSVHIGAMQLREYLEANNITITDFAKMVGVARITIYSYLTKDKHRSKSPSAETLGRIFDATNGQVRPDDFFSFCEPPEPAEVSTCAKGKTGSINAPP
jgi:transcriptional regulator with XRE-family HTH domain